MLSVLLTLISKPHEASAHVFINDARVSDGNAHVFTKKAENSLERLFATPPDSARPWVYWYFMEGNMTREGMTADLEAMKKAGIGGGIFLEANIGIPRGPVLYMSPRWRSLVDFGISEADRLGLGFDLGTGPGWCGSGGPWVTPDQAMQHLVASSTSVEGPVRFSGRLPRPVPHNPWFGVETLTPKLKEQWTNYYRDEVVLAVPTDQSGGITQLDDKALVYRPQFSSLPGVLPYLDFDPADRPGVPVQSVVDLTKSLKPDGTLDWDAPKGKWTILRFGRTLTGQTTRPAPDEGLGFETDKFEKTGIDAHIHTFIEPLVQGAGARRPGRGLTSLHWDSWEMNSQNWSPHFRQLFREHRGYDPLPYLPAMVGVVVGSTRLSERFLWDLRQTAQELVIENHMGEIKKVAKKNGLSYSVEPYDQNPTSDLSLGATADEPMCEFWSRGYGFSAEFSCFEAVSIAHTNGKPVIGAEAFTANDGDGWKQHPASMKEQGDWALANGINKFYFHRYQHQPKLNEYPGLTMGPYGVHWERTQTWWDMVPAYHRYLARSQEMLRQGQPVADVLYLVPEGAPNVFQPPLSATIGVLPDRRGHNFDGIAPNTLIARASVKDGWIVFPEGMRYRMLVLPRFDSMTPGLIRKLDALVRAGATIMGAPPTFSPSLSGYPNCDADVQALARGLWGSGKEKSRAVGKGNVVLDDSIPNALEMPDLSEAHWIWSGPGDARREAPLGDHTFVRRFDLEAGRGIRTANIVMTADDDFHLVVNGTPVLQGTNFTHIYTTDLRPYLRAGLNRIEVRVTNEGSSPNPAGLIGHLRIVFNDGGRYDYLTNSRWESDDPVMELGSWKMYPWRLTEASTPRELYPAYEKTSAVLEEKLGCTPDFESSDDWLRYSHRHLPDADLYFVANRTANDTSGDATFRVSGKQAEWWDPQTGERHALPQQTATKDGRTTVPLSLPALGSGFVVFRNTGAPRASDPNFATWKLGPTLSGPWRVDFDPKFAGPKGVRFDKLADWTQRPEPAIRYYSGKATYRTQFDAPAPRSAPGSSPRSAPVSYDRLSLGTVCNIASVRLNGRDLGVVWCHPWSCSIPAGTLRKKGNVLEVTVANLWANRLIRDTMLPPEQQITKTTWNPYKSTSPLLPSGLLGPVRLMTKEKS